MVHWPAVMALLGHLLEISGSIRPAEPNSAFLNKIPDAWFGNEDLRSSILDCPALGRIVYQLSKVLASQV